MSRRGLARIAALAGALALAAPASALDVWVGDFWNVVKEGFDPVSVELLAADKFQLTLKTARGPLTFKPVTINDGRISEQDAKAAAAWLGALPAASLSRTEFSRSQALKQIAFMAAPADDEFFDALLDELKWSRFLAANGHNALFDENGQEVARFAPLESKYEVLGDVTKAVAQEIREEANGKNVLKALKVELDDGFAKQLNDAFAIVYALPVPPPAELTHQVLRRLIDNIGPPDAASIPIKDLDAVLSATDNNFSLEKIGRDYLVKFGDQVVVGGLRTNMVGNLTEDSVNRLFQVLGAELGKKVRESLNAKLEAEGLPAVEDREQLVKAVEDGTAGEGETTTGEHTTTRPNGDPDATGDHDQ